MEYSHYSGRSPASIGNSRAFEDIIYRGRSPISGCRNPDQCPPASRRMYNIAQGYKMPYEDKDGNAAKETIAFARSISMAGR